MNDSTKHNIDCFCDLNWLWLEKKCKPNPMFEGLHGVEYNMSVNVKQRKFLLINIDNILIFLKITFCISNSNFT